MALYSFLLVVVLAVGSPYWLVRMLGSGRYRAGLGQRLGRVPAELREAARGAKAEGRAVVWLHAVSVGEVLAGVGLVRELERAAAERGERAELVVISTTTEAGQRVARERFPDHAVFYLPLDLAMLVRRYLRVLEPRLLVLMESELWPNLLGECERAGCTVVVANARISDRSFPRYMRLRRLWRPLLGKVRLFLAQGEETAARLRAIGVAAERVVVTGNLKFDMPEPPRGVVFERLRAALAPGARLLVAGSTLAGEEALLLSAWPAVVAAVPEAVLLLAPRHTDRFAAVAEMVREAAGVRASGLREGAKIAAGGVVVLDTIGDLGAVYGLGAAAFVGGSLVPAGGHNPLEPARFEVPVVMGQSVENFREVVRVLEERGAMRRLKTTTELVGALTELLAGGPAVRAMGERGRAVFMTEAGAARRSVEKMLAVCAARHEVAR